ncbi:frataxin, mitochondrial [Harmonia axyridis]|uniref:frataxin, mitochondrial n=1 Tax=Harmonia axyridis TaxID=115357 RepID=UPI001E275A14|nr:frataxin, mitochondrial [Harmonia axyridis]
MSNYLHRNTIRLVRNLRYASRLSKLTSHLKFEENIPFKIPLSHNFNTRSNIFIQNRDNSSLSDSLYEKVCQETLQSLTEFFEELQEEQPELVNGDISYNDGVLTINLGQFGIYVINRQLPNKQIWLSSPVSGPKRYDYENGGWIYKHNNETLHTLLKEELSKLLNKPIDLSQCTHYRS